MDVIFRKVRERDIDLLLLEQLCCSAEFVNWFFLQVTKRQPARLKLLSAKHSVVGSLGQTDIEVTVVDGGGRKAVFLIENKIARTKQPTQPERYKARCATYPGHKCWVVLVAPKRYATRSFVQASFGSKGPVAYETLLLDSMRGDATLFTRRDEVEAEWHIITPIEEAWAHLPVPTFPNYAAGSEGPTSWHELLEIRGNTAEQVIGYGK